MTNLCILFGLNQLNQNISGCYESGYFGNGVNNQRLIVEAIKQINKMLRLFVIPIIESLKISDESIMSAIGNSYGDIYEQYFEWAKDSKMNHTKAGDAIPDGLLE